MGGAPQLPFGLSTSPGNLPVCAVDDAVEMALRGRDFPTVPIPSVPSMSLAAQASTAFEGVFTLPTGALRLEADRFGVKPDAATELTGEGFEPLHAFLAAWPAAAERRPTVRGFRVDMAGPVTLALELAAGGLPLTQALDGARVVSAMRAEALIRATRTVEAERCVAVVMHEPRLVGAMHPTFPLSVRQVRSLLDPVVDALDRAAGASPTLIGVHVAGRSDWRTIVTSGVSLVSLPPDAGLAGWAQWIQALLDNGGFLAWGAVPVDRPLGTGEELIWRHLGATWADLAAAGVDPELLRRRSLVTPADGLGHFAPEQVDGVMALVDALGERVRRQATGPRIGVAT